MTNKYSDLVIDEKELDKQIDSGKIKPVHIPQFASLGGKMRVEIELDRDQIDQIIIKDLKWHAEHAENLEDVEALRRVLHYYKGGDENEL